MLMNINQLAKIHQYDVNIIILVDIHEIDIYSSIKIQQLVERYSITWKFINSMKAHE